MSTDDKPEVAGEGQVAREIHRQGNLADELREIVGKLKERLVSITRELPKEISHDNPEHTTVVPLAEQIEGVNNSTQCSIRMLADLCESIEI